jgi:hypothetical protein
METTNLPNIKENAEIMGHNLETHMNYRKTMI